MGTMRRIYRRRFMKVRFWLVALLLVAATAVAARMMQVGDPPEGPALIVLRTINWAPAVLLALGLIRLLWRQWDGVAFFDVDIAAGRYRAWLWRPVGWRRVEGELDGISGWHYRAGRRPSFGARLADLPVELDFALRPGTRLDAAWRRIAPGAVAAYERDRAAPG